MEKECVKFVNTGILSKLCIPILNYKKIFRPNSKYKKIHSSMASQHASFRSEGENLFLNYGKMCFFNVSVVRDS